MCLKALISGLKKRSHKNSVTTDHDEGNSKANYSALDEQGRAHLLSFQSTRNDESVKQAIELFKEAIIAFEACTIPENQQERLIKAALYNNLGASYVEAHGVLRDIDYLKKAIDSFELAIETTPDGNPDLAIRLSNTAAALTKLYVHDNDVGKLDTAIEQLERARKQPVVDKTVLLPILNNLGGALQKRYEANQRLESLIPAIDIATESVALTIRLSPGDKAGLAERMHNLANLLELLYLRVEDDYYLQMSIRVAEMVLELSKLSQISPHKRAIFADSLAMKRNKWWQLKEHSFHDDSYIQKMLDEYPQSIPGDPDNVRRRHNYAELLEHQFLKTKEARYLQEATQLAQSSVDDTGSNDPSLAQRLHDLGRKHKIALDNMKIPSSSSESFSLPSTLPGNSNILAIYDELSTSVHSLITGLRSQVRQKAISSFMKSWECVNGDTWQRVNSALEVVDLLIESGERCDLEKAKDVAVESIKLLPVLSRPDLTDEDRLHLLPRFAGLAGKACSLILESSAIQENDTEAMRHALEILEYGRGSAIGVLIDQKKDGIADLAGRDPDLANEYRTLLEGMKTRIGDFSSASHDVDRRYKISKKLESCVTRIRKIEGFDKFLTRDSAIQLQQKVEEGQAIIIVNVTAIRSDAIIVKRDNVKSVNLPSFSARELYKKQLQKILDVTQSIEERREKNKELRMFLKWLWDVCVKLILDQMEISSVEHKDIPGTRVWWIGVGEASRIPFHAAGYHLRGSRENTLHYVISSYTPTIKAVAYSRERFNAANKKSSSDCRINFVSMPNTPDLPKLDYLSEEIAGIRDVMPGFHKSEFECPSAALVMENIPSSDILHFAGHGHADRLSPFDSSLVLARDDKQDHLKLRLIWEMDLERAQLVYLSACSTAKNMEQGLADEVVHLASGFQVAGFTNVVATMWEVDNDQSIRLATEFYSILSGDDVSALATRGGVARALHRSIIETRDAPEDVLGWAPYVHYGV